MFKSHRAVALGLALYVGQAAMVSAAENVDQAAPATDAAPMAEAAPAAQKPTPSAAEFFAPVQKKMTPEQVVAAIGAPSLITSSWSGKNFIPFYAGGDQHRVYWSYKGIGVVVFSENVYKRGATVVIETHADPAAP